MPSNSIQTWLTDPIVQTLLIVASGYPLGRLVDAIGYRTVKRIVSHTKTQYDDKIAELLRKPLRWSVMLAAAWVAMDHANPLPSLGFIIRGSIASAALFIWTKAAFQASIIVIEWLAGIKDRFSAVTHRTVPAWTMAAHLLILAIAAYFFFLCWEFDVTGWLASAGIVGVAVGFGAKDTMANLFAGVGILADRPYRLGDFLLLDSGERGRVTDIGLRSTRLMTQDELEIIIPNATMATAKIINESGGPRESERLRIPVRVAYGTDIDALRTLMTAVATQTEGVLVDDPNRQPAVHFKAMGDHGLDFELLCFIGRPELLYAVTDRLNTGLYRALDAAKIEIPYPQQTVHLSSSTQAEQ